MKTFLKALVFRGDRYETAIAYTIVAFACITVYCFTHILI